MKLTAFLSAASAVIQMILAVMVLVRNTGRRENRLFSLLLLLFTAWSLAELYLNFNGIDKFGLQLLFTPGILLGYFFCVFTAIYPEPQPEALIFRNRWAPALLFLPALLLLALLWSGRLISSFEPISDGVSLAFGSNEFLLKGVIILYLFLSLSTLSKSRQKAETTTQMRRLRYTFTAMLLPVAAGSITIALSRWFMGVGTVYTFGLFPVLSIIMSIILSYTMLRYNLMEIDLIFSIGLVYTLLTAILAGCMELMQELLQSILDVSDLSTKILSILVIAGIFSPLKEMLIRLVDRFFGRQSFDSAKVMQTILAELRRQPDQARMLARFTGELQLVLDFTAAETMAVSMGAPAINFPGLPEGLNEVDGIIHHFGQAGDEKHGQIARELRQKDFRHYFPFRTEEEFFGCLLLGPKSTRVPYTEAELNLVAGLANEVPHIIQNLQMIDRLLQQEKASQEISLAAGMLRAISAKTGNSSFAGLKICSFASLAGEIKGDMIDICEEPENSYLSVFDAFHQGIQAVLTLNLVFSVFRTVSDHSSKIATADRLLRHFAGQNLCSAATVLTCEGSGFRLRNCGNPPPILISGEKISELPAGGSKPVGVAAEPATCDIMLQQGELLLISTNGLFKAFKELRGVALTDFLATAAPKGVEECHRILTAEIEPFIRKRYSDDITFIIAGKT
ncbi:hypothetical protein MASR1M12_23770 [Erysipelotrichia bacterium]